MNFEKSCSICWNHKDLFCCYYGDDNDGFITVGIKSAIEIKDKTGREYSDFLVFSKLPDSMIEECMNDADGSEGKLRSEMFIDGKMLRLRTKPDHTCIFLDENHKCSIYKFRPLICRIYPFWYSKNAREVFGIVKHEVSSGPNVCFFLKFNPNINQIQKNEISELKSVAEMIEEEKEHYIKNIKSFVKKNNINSEE